MYCGQQISYVIQPGDNLYQLAKFYQTTVPMILSLNPNTDPYDLQIGSTIVICPGQNFQVLTGPQNPPACPNPAAQVGLMNQMRLTWEQHVYWTRMLIISIAEKLKDQSATTARLLQNPGDIAAIFATYYSPEVANSISQLLTAHLQIGADLVTAIRDKKQKDVERLNAEWYRNADQIADALGSINPYYNRDDLRRMLYTHLDVTKQEADARLNGNYSADIDAFNRIEQDILGMADYLSAGIIRQFPQRFF